jgi:excisionase family DNA binding protein
MLNLTITDEFIAAVATALYAGGYLGERPPSPSPWMTAKQCAEYIGAGVGRIYDLSHVDAIPVHRDGSRLLFHRDEIDRWIRAGGGKRP